MHLRQVEKVKTGRITIGRCPISPGTAHTELHQATVGGTKIAVLVYNAQRNVSQVFAVGSQLVAVGGQLNMMWLPRRTYGLFSDSMTGGIVSHHFNSPGS